MKNLTIYEKYWKIKEEHINKFRLLYVDRRISSSIYSFLNIYYDQFIN